MCSYTCDSDVQIKREVSCVYSVFTWVHDSKNRLQHLATRMGYSIEVLLSSWQFWKLQSLSECFSCPCTWLLALVGSIAEFDTSTETFTAYHEGLKQYFVANSIGHYPSDTSEAVKAAANKKKVAVTISVIGKKTYGTLWDLCSPENPKDKTFEQLCELLEWHFKPKQLVVAESYRFHRCFQEENETVSVYSACLQHLASSCNFGEFLNRLLRDQFVCGIHNPATRKKLLSEDRTFQKAMEVANADEIAAKESIQVQQQLSQPVHAVAKDSPQSPQGCCLTGARAPGAAKLLAWATKFLGKEPKWVPKNLSEHG